MVKSDNESSLYLHAGVLDAADVGFQVAIHVLSFAAFLQIGIIWRFDTDKHLVETGCNHQSHQLGIISQIDGCLSVK